MQPAKPQDHVPHIPMKVLIVYCHPEPMSFNFAMFQVAQKVLRGQGHDVQTSDLYEMGFDPLSSRKNFTTTADPKHLKLSVEEAYATENDGFAPDLEAEIAKMEWCDLMIWQFPFWWFGVPAGLKGWIDRVFAYSRVYGFKQFFAEGTMREKKALLSFTTGIPRGGYRTGKIAGDINQIVKPIHYGILQFTGFQVLPPHIVHAPIQKTDEERKTELSRYEQRLLNIFSETPIETEGF